MKYISTKFLIPSIIWVWGIFSSAPVGKVFSTRLTDVTLPTYTVSKASITNSSKEIRVKEGYSKFINTENISKRYKNSAQTVDNVHLRGRVHKKLETKVSRISKDPISSTPDSSSFAKDSISYELATMDPGDPLRFLISTSKDSVSVGEELELTVTIDMLPISPSMKFTFEELKDYSLRVIFPEGFTQTGGDYRPYISGRISKIGDIHQYKIKGKFGTQLENACFQAIRDDGFTDVSNNIFVKKAEKCLFVRQNLMDKSNRAKVNDTYFDEFCKKVVNDLHIEILKTPSIDNKSIKEIFVLLGTNNNFSPLTFNYSNIVLNTGKRPKAVLKTLRNGQIINSKPLDLDLIIAPNGEGVIDPLLGGKTRLYSNNKIILDNSILAGDIISVEPLDNQQVIEGYFVSSNSVTSPVGCPLPSLLTYKFENRSTTCPTKIGSTPTSTTYGVNVLTPIPPIIAPDGTEPVSISSKIIYKDESIADLIIVPASGTLRFNWPKVHPMYLLTIAHNGDAKEYSYTIKFSNYEPLVCNSNSDSGAMPSISIESNNGTSLCNDPNKTLSARLTNCTTSNIRWSKNNALVTEWNGLSTISTNSSGSYYATCTSSTTAQSNTITLTNSTPSPPNITSDVKILAGTSPVYLQASGCSSEDVIKWYSAPNIFLSTGKVLTVTTAGDYYATCHSSSCGESSPSTYISIQNGLVVKPENTDNWCVYSGQSFTILAQGCISNLMKVQWRKDNLYLKEFDGRANPVVTGPGIYSARCVPIYFEGDTQDPQYNYYDANISLCKVNAPTLTSSVSTAYESEIVTLTASGCTAGYNWDIKGASKFSPSGVQTLDVIGNGVYKVRCNVPNEPNAYGEWSELTITLKELGATNIIASKDKAFAVEAIVLTTSGCKDNATIEWQINDNSYIGETQTVTGPGTYKARCVIGGQVGPWAEKTINPNDVPTVSIHTPKYSIYDNEIITLHAIGCDENSSIMSVQWLIDGNLSFGRSASAKGAGTYQARCTVGNQTGPWATITVNMLPAPDVIISTNKSQEDGSTRVAPFEDFIASTTGCEMASVQWQTPNGLLWGNSIRHTGPGTYQARCVVSNRSIGKWTTLQVDVSPPDAIPLLATKSCVALNEAVVLTTNSCSDGSVMWTLPNLTTEYGRTLTVIGPGTYKVTCRRFGIAGPTTSLQITSCPSNTPVVTLDKKFAKPTDVTNVSLSGCNTYDWYYSKITFTDGRIISNFDKKYVVTGPAKLEVYCNYPGGIGEKQTDQILPLPGDMLRLVPNKQQVAPDEEVKITVYGCDFGKIEWRVGGVIQTGYNNPKTFVGPGEYYARCINDPASATEWTLASIPASSPIGANVSGSTRVCPNNPVTLTASGCPSGWYYQWKTAEKGWSNWENSIKVYLPQKVSVRCNKPDGSYYSETKEIIVESPFSDTFKATNNGPVSSGQVAILTATAIEGATYQWFKGSELVQLVSGKDTLSANGRIITISDASSTHAGDYTVRATLQGGNPETSCITQATTKLTISDCEGFYIKAIDPVTGEETDKMARKPNTTNQFEPLILSISNYETDSKPLYLGSQTAWIGPQVDGSFQYGEDKLTIKALKMGTYQAIIGGSCKLTTTISAIPCQSLENEYKGCGSTSGSSPPNVTLANSIGVGDYFNAGDYEVRVTEIAGNENGWTGKGYTTFNLKGSAELPVSLEFSNIQIDECYRLKSGYSLTIPQDASWYTTNLNPEDPLADIITKYAALQQEIAVMAENFQGTQGEQQLFNQKLAELTLLKQQLTSSSIDEESKATLTEQLDALIDYSGCISNPNSSPQARKDAAKNLCSLNPWAALAKCIGSAALDIFSSYVFKWIELKFDDKPRNFTDYQGITSQMDWKETTSSAAVNCILSVLPIPNTKVGITALAAEVSYAAAEAFATNVLTQYSRIKDRYSSPKEVFNNIDWNQAFSATSGQALIPLAAAVFQRTTSVKPILALHNKVKTLGALKGWGVARAKLKTLGFSDEMIDDIFKKWGVKSSLAVALLPKKIIPYKEKFSESDFTQGIEILRDFAVKGVSKFSDEAEDIIKELYRKKGLTPLDCKLPSNHGFDLVFVDNPRNPTKVIIMEVKSSISSATHSARMNKPVNSCIGESGFQMSSCWIKYVIDSMKQENRPKQISDYGKMIEKLVGAGAVEKYVVSVVGATAKSPNSAKIIKIN